MPRLLLILTEFPPRIGGMQTHAAYLSRYLAQHGYSIEIFTHRLSDPQLAEEAVAYDRAQPFPIHRVLGRLSYQHNLQLLAAHAHRFAPELIYASTVFYGILQQRIGIPVICRSVGNDLLRPWLGYPYRFGSRLLNNAWLEKIACHWMEKGFYPDWIETLFRKRRERLTAASARAASHILANSEFTAQLLRAIDISHARIEIVVGGVDSRRFHHPQACKTSIRKELGLPESGFLVMTACRMVAKKGVDMLFDALPRLCETLPHAHLVIVGDGKYRARFESECIARGIANVTFAGRVPHEQIHRYYLACDLFILASRESINRSTGTRDVETMGRVLCEANAAGIAVVASRSGGIPSVITEAGNGLLFDVDSQDDLIDRIRHLNDDPHLRARIVRQGLERARDEFDWSNVLHAHLRIFNQVSLRDGPLPLAQSC